MGRNTPRGRVYPERCELLVRVLLGFRGYSGFVIVGVRRPNILLVRRNGGTYNRLGRRPKNVITSSLSSMGSCNSRT